MKKLKLFLPIFLLILVLAACGGKDSQEFHGGDGDQGDEKMDESMEALKVKLEGPKQARQGEKVTFSAMVTQGMDNVSDADEVKFEVWKEGAKDDSKMIEAENDGEGMYSVETTFDEEGTYIVQSHVTARSMHTMPKQQVTVGKSK